MIKTKPNDNNYLVNGFHAGGFDKLQVYGKTPDSDITIKPVKPQNIGERNDFAEVSLKARLQKNLNEIQKIQAETFEKKLIYIQEKLDMKRENERMMRLMNLQKNYLMSGMVDELLDKMKLAEQKRINEINKNLLESSEDLNKMIEQRRELNLEQFKEKLFVEKEKIVEVEKPVIVEKEKLIPFEIEKPVIVEKEKLVPYEVEKEVLIKDPEEAVEIGRLQERLRTIDLERMNLEKEKEDILKSKDLSDAEKEQEIKRLENILEKNIIEKRALKEEEYTREKILKEQENIRENIQQEKIASLQTSFIESEKQREFLEKKVEELETNKLMQKEKTAKIKMDLLKEGNDLLKEVKIKTKELPLKISILEDMQDFSRLNRIPDEEFKNFEKLTQNPMLQQDSKGNKKIFLEKAEIQKSLGKLSQLGINVDAEIEKLKFEQNMSQRAKFYKKSEVLQSIRDKYNDYLSSQGITREQLEANYSNLIENYDDVIETLKNKRYLQSLPNQQLALTLIELKEKINQPLFRIIGDEGSEEGSVPRRR